MSKIKILKCAEWLSTCVKAGWDKEVLPGLEKLWNDAHDEKGNLIKGTVPAQEVEDTELWKKEAIEIIFGLSTSYETCSRDFFNARKLDADKCWDRYVNGFPESCYNKARKFLKKYNTKKIKP